MKDRAKFLNSMTMLGEVFNKEISETLLEVYWCVMEPFSDEQCKAAFNHIVLRLKFFPKPADFVEILNGDKVEDKAALAWTQLVEKIRSIGNYRAAKFDDPVIPVVIRAMGGWSNVANVEDKDLPWRKREFEHLYQIMADSGDDLITYLPGQHETENDANGYDPSRKG